MGQRITYYYAVASGFAYLGEPELKRLAKLTNTQIDYRPVEIQTVFSASGTTPPPRQSETRRSYRNIELARWAKRRDLPINVTPRFWPVAVENASRIVIAAQEMNADPGALSWAFLRAVWMENRNIADMATIEAIVRETAPAEQAEELLSRANEDATALIYETITQDAISAGVFGSPTYITENEMFFGQDRLNFVADALGL